MSILASSPEDLSATTTQSDSRNHCMKEKSRMSKFKGVVSQKNGNWGAQIYASRRRIWLGTFKTEKDAAMAYDSAIIRLRSHDSHRNLRMSNMTMQEPRFQKQLSTEQLLAMIKDGSYRKKFQDFLYALPDSECTQSGDLRRMNVKSERILARHLFQKTLTLSDVGSLNRLVIPKNCALKYFPDIMMKDMVLTFHDEKMKRWDFRYCYWKSSHSFVFTNGWKAFVMEMNLKVKDVVSFYVCCYEEESKAGLIFCMIDVIYCQESEGSAGEIENSIPPGDERMQRVEVDTQLTLPVMADTVKFANDSAKKTGFILFGVHIS